MARARSRTRVTVPAAARGSRRWIGIAGVLLLGALAYSSSLRGEFAFDDLPQIVQNLAIRDLGSFVGPGSRGILPNRYVAYLTFAMSYQAGGLDPFGWHLANLAIHLASAVLVWTLVRLAFRTPRLRSSKLAPSSGAIAFAAAALFVAHPLATQAVSYVVQRITSLTTLFYLLAVVLYTAWRLSTGTGARIAAYVGVLVAALLAFRSKEIAFTLPAALALVEWAFFEGGWRRWLPLVPVALLSLLIPLTLVDLGKPVSEVLASADSSTRVSTPLAGRHDYLRTQAVVVARYLGLLVLPVGQTVDHDVAIRRSWLAPDVAGSALLLASLALAGAWLAWRSTPRGQRPPLDPAVRLVALGIAWFFVTLAVESSVIPIADVMNEHRVYLPSAGLFPGIATALALLFLRVDPARVARDTAVAAGLAASLLAVVTWNRNRVWRSEVDLWADAAAKSPGHVRALSNLGAALLKQERYAEAAEVFRRDVEAHPGSVASRVQLGVTLYLVNRPADAERELRRAVELDPNDPDALLNLSVLLRAVGKAPEARPYLERLRRVAKSADERAWAEARLAE